MKIISDEGETLSVKLDVRDLGDNLDSTQRQRASTLPGQVNPRILRTMFIHAALHGVGPHLLLQYGTARCPA